MDFALSQYDGLLFDLDGVLVHVSDPVPGAPEALAKLRSAGVPMMFVTNNASRTGEQVAQLLERVGITAHTDDVITAAQAATAQLADRLPAGARVLVIGSPNLAEEVRTVGLTPIANADDDPAAVLQGLGTNVDWPLLAEGAVALHRGVLWVATNADATLPSARGPLPGNGAFVAALATASGRTPDSVVGKPHPELLRRAAERIGASRPLMVGDRLDTDIAGAKAAGFDSALVLTGATSQEQAAHASDHQRPTFVFADVSALVHGQDL
ncbi:MAG: HAD-IIA family hydrolase [Corynebacteriales bacterium]|nr:HAD-IIA family hydrolase [Mycobacteriales bacterium]